MGFEGAEVGGRFKAIIWAMQPTRGARQFLSGRGFLTMQYCCIETLLQVFLGTVKDVIDTSFPYSTIFDLLCIY